ncbi:hypothetical protein [Arthrobacter sp. GMC3]|uniref:hypothetical protein n=1 Tax=Arthrobacter sp. GMC3 TaxID=2058894 RepID=UPI000CE53CB1|nr:hypothetical protein [Arthrobacter sp. GMC3]
MSKETDPVRSRRELRSAKPEQATGAAGYPSVPLVPAPVAPATDRHGRRTSIAAPAPTPARDVPAAVPIPVQAPDEPAIAVAPAPLGQAASDGVVRERSSQTRARDRAALRAYKELLDSGAPAAEELPSRRALRQAQLEAERAPITSVNPVVPPASIPPVKATTPPVQAPIPAVAEPTHPEQPRQAKAVAAPLPPKQAPSTPPRPSPSAAPSIASAPESSRSRAGRRVAPSPVDATAPEAENASENAAVAAPQAPGAQPPSPVNYPPTSGLVPGGSYHPVSAGPPSLASQTPSTAELAALAEQRAQAERTAILNQRAAARERLAQESAKSRRPASDPTATNNLAMVTPLEFVEVPGLDRPVLRPPVTTHVPIVPRAPRQGHPSRNPRAERFDAALSAKAGHRPGPGTRPLTGGRSNTLKRAVELVAVVQAEEPALTEAVTRTQMPPIPAEYAHGLEPLDAVTAGLGRTQRNMLIQWGSIILGGAAFVVGAVVFITGLVR